MENHHRRQEIAIFLEQYYPNASQTEREFALLGEMPDCSGGLPATSGQSIIESNSFFSIMPRAITAFEKTAAIRISIPTNLGLLAPNVMQRRGIYAQIAAIVVPTLVIIPDNQILFDRAIDILRHNSSARNMKFFFIARNTYFSWQLFGRCMDSDIHRSNQVALSQSDCSSIVSCAIYQSSRGEIVRDAESFYIIALSRRDCGGKQITVESIFNAIAPKGFSAPMRIAA